MKLHQPLLSASLILVLAAPAGLMAQQPGTGLRVNEIMATNASTHADGQGEYDDWIEIYNGSGAPVDLAGMYLTDDLDEPGKWQFPLDNPTLTTIPAGGFLVIWADNDGADPGLHASFKLSADGEQVALFDTDASTLIDVLAFDSQTVDVSFGRSVDGGDDLVAMVYPTPGSTNYDLPIIVLPEPTFSQERGFYDRGFALELATEANDATILYTLDGRDPAEKSGNSFVGAPYTAPITITTTTCVRAVTTRGNDIPSATVTYTYIFAEDVIHQPERPAGFPTSWRGRTVDYEMDPRIVDNAAYRDEIVDDLKSTPSISIVMSNDDLFGVSGIYSHPAEKGDEWERATSMEWIDPATGESFGVNAGLRIHGGDYSRTRSTNPKSGLQFFFRAQYGRSRLRFPLFPDTEVEEFDRLGLREIWNYSWIGDSGMSGNINADYLRDVFARDTVRDMDRLTPYGRPVQVYINGLYWGLYILVERIDDVFTADHLGGDPEDYDVLEAPSNQGGGTAMKVLTGDRVTVPPEWTTLFQMADTGNFSTTEDYEAIQEYVDVPAMIDYMMMIYYTGSRDAPVFLGDQRTPRNYCVVRRDDPAGPFIFVPWDVEWALESPTENRVGIVGVWNPHVLMDRLSANPDFRMLVADHAYRHFRNGGTLTVEAAVQRYLGRADEIRGAIVGESARWGDVKRSSPYTRENWQAEVDRLVNQYFSVRTEVVVNQLKSRGWYPFIEPPIFQIDGADQHGGITGTGASLALVNPNAGGTMWYTLDGSDPRLEGVEQPSTSGLELIAENAPKRVLVPTGPVDDAWRGGGSFDHSAWTYGTGGVGYERSSGYQQYFNIDVGAKMYGINESCYIRIPFNVAADKLAEVSSLVLKMRYDDGFIAYLNGVEVQRALFDGTPSWDSGAITDHSDIDAMEFDTFNISQYIDQLRPGSNILAIHGLNRLTTSSDLLFSATLSASLGGGDTPTGVSPTAIRYAGPVTLDSSVQVKARVLNGTTWSALHDATYSVGPVADSLRISEIMYHPAETGLPEDPNTEFIELTNIGAETINLNMVRFTNGIDLAFGDVDLAPGGYLLLVQDVAAFQADYGTEVPVVVVGPYAGRLDNAGERLTLQDAAGQTILSFRYRDGWYDLTDGGGFSLTAKDPAGTEANAYGDKNAWRPSIWPGGSPGYDDSDETIADDSVVINELMTAGSGDWIELHNTTAEGIDIGGWFLSDDDGELMKYEIAAGTILPAGGYVVFYDDQHFGNPADPGCSAPFGLSRDGETLYLHSGTNGVLTGRYSTQQEFGGSVPGVSLGRYQAGAGTYAFGPLSEPTPGSANVQPQVGSVVISEIMYHPPGDGGAEYVELMNLSDSAVTLYDAELDAPWRFTDNPGNPTVDFLFPTDPAATLASGECLVLAKGLVAFYMAYMLDLPDGVQVLAWGEGALPDDGATLQLSRPGAADGGVVDTWVQVDKASYTNSQPQANGQGSSLTRIDPAAPGEDSANWQAAAPSPGQP